MIRATARRWCTVSFLILLGFALPAPGVSAAPTTVCTSETYVSDVTPVLPADGIAVDTGLIVPVRTGTTLTVTSLSAEALDQSGFATVVPVAIGGVTAVLGAVVPGGRVTITNPTTVPLTSAGLILRVDRCGEIASAPAVPGQQARPTTLPATGDSATRRLALGSLMIAVGAGLVVTARARATADDLEPGWRRAARRRARG
ncbi:MAG: hypothetical protein ACOYL9_02840 [Ilumatobacteraceae bacterium]